MASKGYFTILPMKHTGVTNKFCILILTLKEVLNKLSSCRVNIVMTMKMIIMKWMRGKVLSRYWFNAFFQFFIHFNHCKAISTVACSCKQLLNVLRIFSFIADIFQHISLWTRMIISTILCQLLNQHNTIASLTSWRFKLFLGLFLLLGFYLPLFQLAHLHIYSVYLLVNLQF